MFLKKIKFSPMKNININTIAIFFEINAKGDKEC